MLYHVCGAKRSENPVHWGETIWQDRIYPTRLCLEFKVHQVVNVTEPSKCLLFSIMLGIEPFIYYCIMCI